MDRKVTYKTIHNIYRLAAFLVVLALIFSLSFNAEAAGKGTLNSTKVTMHVGSTFTLTLTGAKAVSWKSSNKKIATVNSKGKIKAKKKGNATVTCTDNNGNTYKCKVVVKKHNYKTVKSVAATKYKKGYTIYACSECMKTYKKTTVYSPTESQVRKDILALKSKYPEGKKWTTAKHYTWDASIYYEGITCVGGGCVAFAFMASDAAFGKYNKSRKISGKNWYKNIRVGDIIRVEDGSHTVVVIQKKKNSVVVVEGSYNDSVHWGRELSMSYIKAHGTYLITRYPE